MRLNSYNTTMKNKKRMHSFALQNIFYNLLNKNFEAGNEKASCCIRIHIRMWLI